MAQLASVMEDDPLPPVDDPALLLGLPRSPDTAVVALDDDGRPVGAAWWHLRDRSLVVAPDGAPVPETVVAVVPAVRGQGVRSSPARRPRGPRRRARPRPVGPQRPHPQPRRPPLQPRGVRGRGEGPRTARRRDGPGAAVGRPHAVAQGAGVDPRRRCGQPAGAAHRDARQTRGPVRRRLPPDRLPVEQLPAQQGVATCGSPSSTTRPRSTITCPTAARGISTAPRAACWCCRRIKAMSARAGRRAPPTALWRNAELIRQVGPEVVVLVERRCGVPARLSRRRHGAPGLRRGHDHGDDAGRRRRRRTLRRGAGRRRRDRRSRSRLRLQAGRARERPRHQRGVRLDDRPCARPARTAGRRRRRRRSRRSRRPAAARTGRRRVRAQLCATGLLARRRHDATPTGRRTWTSCPTSRPSISTTRRGRCAPRAGCARRRGSPQGVGAQIACSAGAHVGGEVGDSVVCFARVCRGGRPASSMRCCCREPSCARARWCAGPIVDDGVVVGPDARVGGGSEGEVALVGRPVELSAGTVVPPGGRLPEED